MKKLVIVESPAKSKTIEKYLGSDYRVMATYGHVRDLPTSRLGIDIENNFAPEYIVPTKSKKTISAFKKALATTSLVILATDPDREGEAISWHVVEALKLKKVKLQRIEFHEITKEAISKAVNSPRDIDINLVNAQQARRVLDRLVGYSLSPLLWKKVLKGLSAGRVQSVAVRLIVDREREIDAFKPNEYWEMKAKLDKKETNEEFIAKVNKYKNKPLAVSNKTESEQVIKGLPLGPYKVDKVETKEVKRSPAPPFITSTLQQEAARKLYFSAKKTMAVAQQLYEGIELEGKESVGLITYMRTDSTNLSTQALSEARDYIQQKVGREYVPVKPRVYKKAKSAQEAHEAIRPTSFSRTSDTLKAYLSKDQLKLYELIWKRALASQMSDCLYSQTGIDITIGEYNLHAGGRTIKFSGFMSVYLESEDDKTEDEEKSILPKLSKGDICNLKEVFGEQKFTEPPPRYSEASLIKELEANGIGRPSTYAPTISTIQERGYIQVENRRLFPNDIAYVVIDLLRDHFPFVVSVDFTAHVEKELDDVADGKEKWQEVIKEFWHPFEEDLKKASTSIEKVKLEKATDEICEKCGKPMVIKHGRFGEFLACTGFPECRNTRPLPPKNLGLKCPKCHEGDIVERRTKKGKLFWGCSRYPECDYATWTKPKTEEEQ
ncbi:MAG: type I DNA topoisomerase [Patescibacteria group bacterium]|nr:type I DNA topoisomerase [Patescibacteria group bacterium]